MYNDGSVKTTMAYASFVLYLTERARRKRSFYNRLQQDQIRERLLT